MNIISNFVFLLVLIFECDFTTQIKWKIESNEMNICKGDAADFIWELSEEESNINTLEWYFNNRTICITSDAGELNVKPGYQGRIERLNNTGIQLKNVSLYDEGTYTLFPVVKWSMSQSIHIFLHILEPPTNRCILRTNFLKETSNITCEPSSECGRPQMSVVWKRNKTMEVLGEGNHIFINSSFYDNNILCCLQGKPMDCIDDPTQVCTTINIPEQDDKRLYTSSNSTLSRDPVSTPVTHHHDTAVSSIYIQMHLIVVLVVVASLIIISLLVSILYLVRKMRKSNQRIDQLIHRLDCIYVDTEHLEQPEFCPLRTEGIPQVLGNNAGQQETASLMDENKTEASENKD